jgi:hypothetical protein
MGLLVLILNFTRLSVLINRDIYNVGNWQRSVLRRDYYQVKLKWKIKYSIRNWLKLGNEVWWWYEYYFFIWLLSREIFYGDLSNISKNGLFGLFFSLLIVFEFMIFSMLIILNWYWWNGEIHQFLLFHFGISFPIFSVCWYDFF